MEKKDVKKAVESAEKELKDGQIEKVKNIVKATLEKMNKLDESIREQQAERKILKLDIDDLKDGRLDRIEERQNKDSKAKKASIIKVTEKEVHHHHHYDYPWYRPYIVEWNYTSPNWINNQTLCGTANSTGSSDAGSVNLSEYYGSCVLDGSTTKINTTGAYTLSSGNTIHLR